MIEYYSTDDHPAEHIAALASDLLRAAVFLSESHAIPIDTALKALAIAAEIEFHSKGE